MTLMFHCYNMLLPNTVLALDVSRGEPLLSNLVVWGMTNTMRFVKNKLNTTKECSLPATIFQGICWFSGE